MLIEVIDKLFIELTSENTHKKSIVYLQYLIEKTNEIGNVVFKEERERINKGES
ncbi:hypothetical protein [Acinetobacter harbinensis]